VQDAQGQVTTLDLAQAGEGERLYFNFWASYCSPCIKELPDLQALHGEEGSRVIGLSADTPAGHARALDLLEKQGAKYPALFLPTEATDAPLIEAWADLERLPIPTTLVIAPDGTLEKVIRGVIQRD